VTFEEFKNPAGTKLLDRAQALIDGSLVQPVILSGIVVVIAHFQTGPRTG